MVRVDARQGAPKDGNSPYELFQVFVTFNLVSEHPNLPSTRKFICKKLTTRYIKINIPMLLMAKVS